MTRSVVGRLIAKDLYLYRWLIAGTILAGVTSIGVAARGGASGTIGGILLVTSVITLGVFLSIHALLSERQSKALLFVLSLPISPMQYAVAKIAASLLAFLIPWTALTGLIVGLELTYGSAGDLAFTGILMGFLLANFCILIAVGIVTGSEFWAVVGILVTNTSVPVFMSIALPALRRAGEGQGAAWSPAVAATLGAEAAVIALSLGIAFYVQARRHDHV